MRSWHVLALTGVVGAGLVLLGVAAGAVPLTGVEPPGLSFVDCGLAVFGRPDPLPHPTCAGAYAPLTVLTWLLLVAGVATLVAGPWAARRLHRRR